MLNQQVIDQPFSPSASAGNTVCVMAAHPGITLPLRIAKGPYPDLRIDTATADPAFVAAVCTVLKGLHFQDVTRGDTTLRKTMALMKSKGLTEGFRYYLMHAHFCKPPYTAQLLRQAQEIFETEFASLLGDYVMERLTPEQVSSFFPVNDFEFHVHDDGHNIEVRFLSLESFPLDTESIYYSSARPSIFVEGKPQVVTFNRHSLERLQQRVYAGTLDYRKTGSLHQRLQCDHLFQACTLYNGQPAFAFWARARTGFLYRGTNGVRYLRELLPSIDANKEHWYLLGYCPVTVHYGFAVAQTLLYPGFKNTPEYGVIMNAGLTPAEKDQLLERVRAWEEQWEEAQTDMALVKWFHLHGSPQVLSTDQRRKA